MINNAKFINRAKIIKDKGTNRDLFNQNIVKKYSWVDCGSSYGLSEINAAFLYSQFKQGKKITKKRVEIFNQYHKLLRELEIKNLVTRPTIPRYAKHNGHIYYLIIKKNRDKLIKYLKRKKIISTFHYIPLHSSLFGKLKSKTKSSMKYTNFISKKLLRLPMNKHLNLKSQMLIKKNIFNFFKLPLI